MCVHLHVCVCVCSKKSRWAEQLISLTLTVKVLGSKMVAKINARNFNVCYNHHILFDI